MKGQGKDLEDSSGGGGKQGLSHDLSRDVSLSVQFYLVMKGQGKDPEDPSGGGGKQGLSHDLSRDVSLYVQFYLVMKGQGKDLEDPSGGGGGAKAFQKKFNKPALNRYCTRIS
jgi:hypothetical protein